MGKELEKAATCQREDRWFGLLFLRDDILQGGLEGALCGQLGDLMSVDSMLFATNDDAGCTTSSTDRYLI